MDVEDKIEGEGGLWGSRGYHGARKCRVALSGYRCSVQRLLLGAISLILVLLVWLFPDEWAYGMDAINTVRTLVWNT